MRFGNILLIDDDADDQEIFISALNDISEALDYTALADASIALKKKLESKELTPDVIFLDLNMPIMTGEQFLIAVKNKEGLKNIPVYIFSTTSHSKTIQHTLELGAQDFITKPNKFDDLVNILKSII